jgi:hypothetical protein
MDDVPVAPTVSPTPVLRSVAKVAPPAKHASTRMPYLPSSFTRYLVMLSTNSFFIYIFCWCILWYVFLMI